jgi:hypothetical protein
MLSTSGFLVFTVGDEHANGDEISISSSMSFVKKNEGTSGEKEGVPSSILVDLKPFLGYLRTGEHFMSGTDKDAASPALAKGLRNELLALIVKSEHHITVGKTMRDGAHPSRTLKPVWTYIIDTPTLVDDASVDALTHLYLGVREATSRSSPLSLTLYDVLNLLIAARDEGGTEMLDVMENQTKKAFELRGGCKDRFLDGGYGRESRVLVDYFNQDGGKGRQGKMRIAIICLVILNIFVFLGRAWL